jgi:hypothetical protein
MNGETKLKFIQLTPRDSTQKKFYINIEMIGDISDVITGGYTRTGYAESRYTNVGCLTHNNGGFNVTETADEILNLINN